ncbi:cation-transporting P-type ATPase [Desulfovibrio oxyclinae]|uniref:cation-transporting P-type ATPase n=1 Tax=Desulfovibrio oxyclinae TaxID=63560 RepID=UPI0003792C27|nr:cation-transporting P-type ATPase [Desulfovibrio oxyclinae]
MESLLEKHWYHMPAEEVADLLDTDPEKGLDQFESERRLKNFGPNVISGKKQATALQRLLLQFHQPLVYILIVAGIITAALGEWVDSSVILAVVLVNALVGFFQESKAVKALNSLAASMHVEATVIRAGETLRLDAADIVPGDIIILRSGDKVPADVRIVRGKELRVDESTLTGESVPVEKNGTPADHDAVLADRTSMAFAGTLVSYGQGYGIVVATGNKTEIGRISGMIDAAEELDTPLTRKITRFSHILLVAILALAGASFALGMMRAQPVTETFMAAVALAVGAIPEGLPAAVTIILALGVSRMAEKKAIIRKLPAVETLGGTTVICSDKTGTLTENQMTVQEIHSGDSFYDVTGTGYSSQGELASREAGSMPVTENTALRECLRAGMLCNDAVIRHSDDQYTVEGDPTEAALLVSALKYGLSRKDENANAPRKDELPFESEMQYMVTLHREDDRNVAYMKGAAEKIFDYCSKVMNADGTLSDIDRKHMVAIQHELASKGLRVLALARKELPDGKELGHEDVAEGMILLGVQGMIDPPREEAKRAVGTCLRAGIRVKMITGDHAVTAEAIGMMLGLGGDGCTLGRDCPVLTGKEIGEMTDRQLRERVQGVPVFARVSPEQKLRLVMALQSHGEVCAMTGDGVNDAPALKQADIGIAMGISGTEAAKEAADMVLTDDNFSTIEAAVEEGRGVFANLVKFIAWTLPTNAGEGLVILTAILFGATLPILPLQILWINMTTAGCLGMMLAFEPKEPGIMERTPRRPDRPILDKVILSRIALVSVLLLIAAFGLFKWELLGGASVEKARTMAVNVFVAVEAFYLFNSRSFRSSPFTLGFMSNPWVPAGFGIMAVLQLLYTYAPFMQNIFQSAPLDFLDWLKIIGCGIIAFLLVEADKKRVESDI